MGRGRSKFGKGGSANYQKFADKRRDDDSYTGDAETQKAFFSAYSNVDELIDTLSASQKLAFDTWASGDFMDGQQYGGWDSMSESDKEYTQAYDDVLDRATLTRGVLLARASDAQLVLGKGNTFPSLSALQAAEGSLITSKGNMSFAAASEGLPILSGAVQYKLKIPPSTGAGMWIGDERINPWGAIQREFMTNRDSVFRVGKTKSTKDGNYIVELEYVGRQKHDYGTSGRV